MICDDSAAIHSSLAGYLEKDGLEVVSVYDGETALEMLRTTRVDVLLLDIMLPGMDGYEVCRQIRRDSDVYIMMLSARGEEYERIFGLEVGADDYVTKPFSPRQVSMRIQRILDRLYPRQERKKLSVAELSVYPESYQVFVGDQEIRLTSKETEVLIYMMGNVGKVLTREHILNAAWGYDYFGDSRVVDSMIKTLRHKLQREDTHFAIRTIYGTGYKLEERQ
jgi:DNA-binding response OmpR family regulator